jgi:SPW repeat
MKDRRWQDVVMFILGLWLVISPFALQFSSYTEIAALNSYVFGVGVMVLAAIALARPRMWEEQVNVILGVWLFLAPFVLGFQTETAAMVNHLLLGLLIVGDAMWAVYPYYTHKPT